MFSPEYYLGPYIAAYLGKYVINFNRANFQVSLWQGDAFFQNLDLNLSAIDKELIKSPFKLLNGHIHEMKISVPWTRILYEPIVVTTNTIEVALTLRKKCDLTKDDDDNCGNKPTHQNTGVQTEPLTNETPGYVQGFLNKVTQNVKVVCNNLILKFCEDEFVFSFNFQNVTLHSVNESWEQAFIDTLGTDFLVRRKLLCSDLTVCLDSANSILKNCFSDPLMYKCAFECRIITRYKSLFSKVPTVLRLDVLFDHIHCSIIEDQIPKLLRFYNLLVEFTRIRFPDISEFFAAKQNNDAPEVFTKNDGDNSIEKLNNASSSQSCLYKNPNFSEESNSTNRINSSLSTSSTIIINSETSNLTSNNDSEDCLSLVEVLVPDQNSFQKSESTCKIIATIPDESVAIPDCDTSNYCDQEIDTPKNKDENNSLYDWASWAIGWLPVPNILSSVEEEPAPVPLVVEDYKTIYNIGIYVKTMTTNLRMTDRVCDKSSTTSSSTSSRVKSVPFLRCQFQGLIIDFTLHGVSTSFRGGFSKLKMEGVGSCPCGLNNCLGNLPQYPDNLNFGITYLDLGSINENFLDGSLFREGSEGRSYECRFSCKGYETVYTEEEMLRKTPGFAFDSVELVHTERMHITEPPCCVIRSIDNIAAKYITESQLGFDDPNNKMSTRIVLSPCRLKASTGFLHRMNVLLQSCTADDFPSNVEELEMFELRMYLNFRMDVFQCVFCDGDTGSLKDAYSQMALEISEVKMNFDARLHYTKFYLKISQILLVVFEEPPELPKTAITGSITGLDFNIFVTNRVISNVKKAKELSDITLDMSTITLSTMIGDRVDVLLSPIKMRICAIINWHNQIQPSCTMNFYSDPLTFFFGPQNILAFLQLYSTLEKYFILSQPILIFEEEELETIIDVDRKKNLILKAQMPNICVHFINHQTFAGKVPESRLCMYSMDGLINQIDQPFGRLDISNISIYLNIHKKTLTFETESDIRITVVDYGFLTDITAVEPFHIKTQLHCVPEDSTNGIRSITITSSSIVVKIGASTLHTIITSTLLWMQVLKAHHGDVIDPSNNNYQTQINTAQILICNDTDMEVGIIQMNTTRPITICSRHAYAFTWTTQKQKSEIKLGVHEDGKWLWCREFPVNKSGTIVKTLGEKSFFITTEYLYASQIMVTIYGCFNVVNALDIPIEVGLLGTSVYKEIVWTVNSRSYGPSLTKSVKDVSGLRFKISDAARGNHGWSHSLTMDDILNSNNHKKCITLYEDKDGSLQQLNIWCSLVEETICGICRYIAVLSPFFRLRSLLSSSAIARLATAKNDEQKLFDLEGRGSEEEIEYLGDDKTTWFLTFQSERESFRSSAPIPLLPGGDTGVENSEIKRRPINDILKDILKGRTKRKSEVKWPFTRESFEVKQWVRGASENLNVKVDFKPWILGLPSILIEAKPEVIFTNLTGHAILFREESTEISIPNRAAFSPQSFRAKFSFGFNCFSKSSSIVWSNEIQISEFRSPSDIHHVNADWKIPLGCFSRLEINDIQMQIHITIETQIQNGIIILSLRPTFNIQNKTEFHLSTCGISLYYNRIPGDDVLGLQDNYIKLEPNDTRNGDLETAVGLLSFNCDWDVRQGDIYTAGMKYIALRYANSPWWFVQLMKFESIFDNLSAPQGVPVKRIAVAIPSCQPHWAKGDVNDLPEVTLPLSLCWTCKDGQVWISIAIDENPQVIIKNESFIPLCYSEGILGKSDPQIEYTHFPQFRCLAPHTTGFYAFPSLQQRFPEVMNVEPMAALIFGFPNRNYNSVRRLSLICRDKSSIEWSVPVRCEDCEEFQLIQFCETRSKTHLKVLAEKLGFTYYIYIKELSAAEVVSPQDVRSRITLGEYSNSSVEMHVESETNLRFLRPVMSQMSIEMNLALSSEQLAAEIKESQSAMQFARRFKSLSDLYSDDDILSHVYYNKWNVFLPEVRIIFTDDFTHLGMKREIVSFIMTDFFYQCDPIHGKRSLRILNDNKAEYRKMTLTVGDIEVDNALFEEKLYDFPVLFKRNEKYSVVNLSQVEEAEDNEKEEAFYNTVFKHFQNQPPILKMDLEFLIPAPEAFQRLLSIQVTCEPFAINIEDKFLDFIFPVFQNFTKVVTERLTLLQTGNRILQAQRKEHHSHDNTSILIGNSTLQTSIALQNLPIRFTSQHDSNPKALIEILSVRRLNENSILNSPEAESPGLRSPFNEGENNSLQIHHPYPLVLSHTDDRLVQRPLYADIRTEYLWKREKLENEMSSEEILSKKLSKESSSHSHRDKYLPIPQEIVSIIKDLATPVQLQHIKINNVITYLTFRGRYKGMYLSFDNSPILLSTYESNYVITTMFTLGDTFGSHYLLGAIYRAGNPVRLIGSLELIGSPVALARSVGSGFKDFVVYPVRGIMNGPMAFIGGLNNGFSSLIRNVSSGTLTSVTNFAWSVSRNIDRLTLDEHEQLMVEESRRVPIGGISDGLVHGLTGFGIRLLGAIGGIAQQPIEALMDDRASPIRIVSGIGKGLIGAVTKPVGATAELVAMTGQGLLQEAGWTNKFNRKYNVYVEDSSSCPDSLLKQTLLERELGDEAVKRSDVESQEQTVTVLDFSTSDKIFIEYEDFDGHIG